MAEAASNSSSSSSDIASRAKYDVFLNFRGEDTRCIFTCHLYKALCRKSINAFMDDEAIDSGDGLSSTLFAAIHGAKLSIVILSKNYASSRWCLNELVEIMECRKTKQQIVVPVFYHIDPADVRKQSGPYENAFATHERLNPDKVQKWRKVLEEVANLGGWDSKRIRLESDLVENITEKVLGKLSLVSNPEVSSSLVGIDKHVDGVESLLRTESENVGMVGIWGMGGIGKTTIAEIIYKKHSAQFGGCCFLGNVREELEKQGKEYLRNKLWSTILGDHGMRISTPWINSFVEDRLRQRKVLIVLDDVNSTQQIEDLVGENPSFGPGSKIIVTTRDKDVINQKDRFIYEVPKMNYEKALHLFSLKAFQQDHPNCEFIELSRMVVNYAKGNPLALKVLGSFLRLKSQEEWKSMLKKLKRTPKVEIYNVLSLSYERLDDEEKQIFLEIACCLKGETKWLVTNLLDGCGFSTCDGLRSLENKSLITISENCVQMHDLVQEIGWQVVRKKHPTELGKRSRLWDPDEIYQVLKRKRGTDYSVQSILLNMAEIKDVEIGTKTFNQMQKLRILKFYLPHYDARCNVHIPEGLESLPDELRYLHWDLFPVKCLPSSFCPEMLVHLNLQGSLIEKLWDGEQDLPNLKSLFLSGCKHLIQLPNLSKAKNLEEIHLDYCVRLRDFPSYFFSLDRLMALNLSGCRVLRRIRSNRSSSLRWLNLSGCSLLSEFSVTSDKLEYLSLDGTALEEMPLSVGVAKNLSFLSLAGCKILENIPNNFYSIGLDACVKIANCPKLRKLPSVFETSSSITSLYLDGCSNLSELPENLSFLSALSELSLRGSSIKTLPPSIGSLSHLTSLNVSHCKRLQLLPRLPLLLRELDASGCVSLRWARWRENSFKWLCPSSERHMKDVGLSLRHRDHSQRFEFYGSERLGYVAREIILVEAVNRMKYAAYVSSILRASAESDPYHQFCQFSKNTDAQSFEYTCRRLCTSSERHKFPSWFWLRRVESSTVSVKLNGNCCSYCRYHPYAFGIYLSNKEENIDLGFDGRQRICMQQWNEAPIWSYWKLGCNDVRLSLPGSRIPQWFGDPSKDTNITINLSPDSRLLGFIFCVVITDCLPNVRWCLSNVKCKCYLENEGKRSQSHISAYSCDAEMDLVSDTVFAWYDAYTCNRILEAIEESRANDQCTTYKPKLSFQFSIAQESLHYQIKEFGVRLMYASDFESENLIESAVSRGGRFAPTFIRMMERMERMEIMEMMERMMEMMERMEMTEMIVERRMEMIMEMMERMETIKMMERMMEE